MKFTSDIFGTITAIRFYKATANTGTHVGSLWTSTGQLLAQATFTGETASGWQQVSFSKPVPVVPGTTYVASYFAPKGHYSDDVNYFYGPPPVMAAGPTWSTALRCTRSRPGLGRQRRLHLRVHDRLPEHHRRGRQLLGRRGLHALARARTGHQRDGDPGFGSAPVSWTAPTSGGPVTTYTVTPYLNGVQQTTTATVTGRRRPRPPSSED